MAQRVLNNFALLQGTEEAVVDYSNSNSSEISILVDHNGNSKSQQLELTSTIAMLEPWLVALPTANQLSSAIEISNSSNSSALSISVLPLQRWLAREFVKGSTAVNLVRSDCDSIM